MATLADVYANVADMLRRPGDADTLAKAKAEVGNAVRHYNRRVSWMLERRNVTVALTSGSTFYSTVATASSQGWGDSASGTSGGTSAASILRVIHAKLEQGSIDWPLSPVGIAEFETLLEGNTISGTPRYYTHFAGRLGFWPVPNASLTAAFVVDFKPGVPTSDDHESLWFDENRELIEVSAARRVASKWLHDAELTQAFMAAEAEQEAELRREGVARMATGRLRAHA